MNKSSEAQLFTLIGKLFTRIEELDAKMTRIDSRMYQVREMMSAQSRRTAPATPPVTPLTAPGDDGLEDLSYVDRRKAEIIRSLGL